MPSSVKSNAINALAIAGLAVGAAFGMGGSFVAQPHLRTLLWMIDGAGLVMAAALLMVKYLRSGADMVAAGFLAFSIAEGVVMAGNAGGLQGSVPAFAAGTALWALGLAMISVPRHFLLPVRLLGLLSAVLFAVVSARICLGAGLTPVSAPLPAYGYPVLVLTFIGWIWELSQERA